MLRFAFHPRGTTRAAPTTEPGKNAPADDSAVRPAAGEPAAGVPAAARGLPSSPGPPTSDNHEQGTAARPPRPRTDLEEMPAP
jgi:hypothetical protein